MASTTETRIKSNFLIVIITFVQMKYFFHNRYITDEVQQLTSKGNEGWYFFCYSPRQHYMALFSFNYLNKNHILRRVTDIELTME